MDQFKSRGRRSRQTSTGGKAGVKRARPQNSTGPTSDSDTEPSLDLSAIQALKSVSGSKKLSKGVESTEVAVGTSAAAMPPPVADVSGISGGTYEYDAIESGHGNKSASKGPQAAPTTIRTNTVTDYQEGICKDYFETGYCGWGDACIFLHTRERQTASYKQDQAWAEEQAKGTGHGVAAEDQQVIDAILQVDDKAGTSASAVTSGSPDEAQSTVSAPPTAKSTSAPKPCGSWSVVE